MKLTIDTTGDVEGARGISEEHQVRLTGTVTFDPFLDDAPTIDIDEIWDMDARAAYHPRAFEEETFREMLWQEFADANAEHLQLAEETLKVVEALKTSVRLGLMQGTSKERVQKHLDAVRSVVITGRAA